MDPSLLPSATLDIEISVASPEFLARVDHLVYAATDLERGIAEVDRLLGIRASPGGRHPMWGTRNALASLGRSCYLEIIAPDPEHWQSPVRPFGLDALGSSRLVAWAAKGSELASFRDAAARRGIALGEVLPGSRNRPDGAVLTWTLTDLRRVVANGVVPFFIDWGESPHPALLSSQGATLVDLFAEHPDADRVRGMLRLIDIDLPVSEGPVPALIARIDCPRGRVELR
jgi:hypothetical protein